MCYYFFGNNSKKIGLKEGFSEKFTICVNFGVYFLHLLR